MSESVKAWGAVGDGVADDLPAIQASISAPEWEKGTDPLTDPSLLPSCAPDNPLEALSWLGDTVEEVAEGLRARGIKGKKNIANACPLSNYLRIWYPNPSVFVNVSCISEEADYYFLDNTPEPCMSFINSFDCGYFPDLISDNG